MQQLRELHQQHEASIAAQAKTAASSLSASVDQMQANNNPHLATLSARKAALEKQLADLQALAAKRSQTLVESAELCRFHQDVDDEEAWIRERRPNATSRDYGNSMSTVAHLIKRHHALEVDIGVRQRSSIDAVVSLEGGGGWGKDRGGGGKAASHLFSDWLKCTAQVKAGRKLIGEGHYASADIQRRLDVLKEQWTALKANAATRNEALLNSQVAHEYLVDANEFESWINEKVCGSETSIARSCCVQIFQLLTPLAHPPPHTLRPR